MKLETLPGIPSEIYPNNLNFLRFFSEICPVRSFENLINIFLEIHPGIATIICVKIYSGTHLHVLQKMYLGTI